LLKQPPGSGVLLPLVNTAAISIELYLKSLSAERIYIADTDMPEISTVSAYAERTGHCLKTPFNAISEDIRTELTAAFDDELRPAKASRSSALLRIKTCLFYTGGQRGIMIDYRD
jgi:hypothetical protein